MKALIVDDDADAMRILTKALEHRGHRVVGCASPFGVSAVVLREAPDLVVLDVMMPGLDGPALSEVLRNLPLKKRPYIVLWSAMDADKLRKIGLESGLPTLQKATPPLELAARLEKLAADATGSVKR